jgi:hypothetical protein
MVQEVICVQPRFDGSLESLRGRLIEALIYPLESHYDQLNLLMKWRDSLPVPWRI